MAKIVEGQAVEEFNTLLSKKDHEFELFFKEKDLGFVITVKNLINTAFGDARRVKDDLLVKLDSAEDSEKGKIKDSLSDMYGTLQNLENKYFILAKEEESRKLK